MDIICGIYKITSPSKKIYIGQSVNIKRRISKYKTGKSFEQPLLNRSIIKHGWKAHSFEVIHQCTKEELNDLEIYYIELFNSFNSKFGLNLHSGGNFHMTSDETKKKISAAGKGRKLGVRSELHKGLISEAAKKRCADPLYRQQMSKRMIGNVPWNKGLNHSEETKQKISNSRTKDRKPLLINNVIHYQCLSCLSHKDSTQFYNTKQSPYFLTSSCKTCYDNVVRKRKEKIKLIAELQKPKP
jgi:group I intron endonuclease